ncbi:sensor histidine kinase [Clostridium felsineum]|uniref:sensor histidine kinase n=1 Tax=Clostridium felsineum TaxID=36839 RepID=UPI00098CBC5F|nr:HAMP domain-containing sensor histidine kinase [Clostridium felsineum]URZ02199.1 Adaptive-response sensory-kinase SasA [Clostridium felsineum]
MKDALKNPEIMKVLQLNFIFGLIFMLVLYIFVNKVSVNANSELIQNDGAIMETLIEAHPEIKNDIISAFTRENTSTVNVKKGIELSKQYGFDDSKYNLNETLNVFHSKLIYITLIIFAFYFIFSVALIITQFRKVFFKINEVYKGAEKIMNGNYSLRLNDYTEGELGKLSASFNRMSSIIENTLNTLKGEKIFLKNMMQDISHQLKTPLSSLKIFNELLLNQSVKDEKTVNEFLYESKKQLDKMEWLIINLLKMARLDAGAIDFKNENKSIEETIDESIRLLKPMYVLKNQEVSVNSTDKSYFKHDKKWLIEAFSNIIKNCIEHTEEYGQIKIEIYKSPIMVKVTIEDNGGGISKEDLPHIFERFYKGKGVYNKNSTGIGLSMAKSIIENQGGFITVKSIIGQGTKFSIVFLYDEQK